MIEVNSHWTADNVIAEAAREIEQEKLRKASNERIRKVREFGKLCRKVNREAQDQ